MTSKEDRCRSGVNFRCESKIEIRFSLKSVKYYCCDNAVVE